jgi:hypothetical protein
MTEPAAPNVYPSEAAARKAGHAHASKTQNAALLYRLQPPEGKPAYLVSTGTKLRVAEIRWTETQGMAVTKLGRFHPNGCYFAVQRNMRRTSTPDAVTR